MGRELRAALHATSLVGLVLSACMLVPALVNLADGHEGWVDFTIAGAVTGTLWLMIATVTRGASAPFSARFGIVVVNMLWWVLPATLVLPFILGPAQMSLADALFETVSGVTTTGSTVLTGLDATDRGTLVWRSMLQWLGGTGILSIGLVVLPALNSGGLKLFRLESSDRSDKVLPRFTQIVKAILVVYVMLTILCAVAYRITGMSSFEAVNHAMTTLSTGGFSTSDQSMGHFQTDATLWVGSLFMALAGLPFTLFIALMIGRQRPGYDPQILWYFIIIATASMLLLVGRLSTVGLSPRGLAEDVFDVISVITTTGFAAGDYTTWGSFAGPLFFLLTFFGGCAGSTAGGLKIYRLVVLAELVRAALRELIHPHVVSQVHYGGRTIQPDIFRSALVMTAAFAGCVGLTTLMLGALGNDLVTSLSGAVTALANVGPGLGDIIGPSGTFTSLSHTSKLVLAAAMIAGRLEIMVVLALLVPALWR